jgi:hypothetical protein
VGGAFALSIVKGVQSCSLHIFTVFTFLAAAQNLVDSLAQRFDAPVPEERHGQLGTFVLFNARRAVTSSAKRRRPPGSAALAQTPDGSFLDLQRNARELLLRCGLAAVPQVCQHVPPTSAVTAVQIVHYLHACATRASCCCAAASRPCRRCESLRRLSST